MSQKEEINESKVISEVHAQMMSASITSYNIFTKKDLNRFLRAFDKEKVPTADLKLAVDIGFLSLLPDNLFLTTVNTYDLVCGQETKNYILERYNKLKQQEDEL